MTGFASVSCDLPQGTLALDIRAVNHRYLDVQFRMPEEFRSLEPKLRELIANHVNRGKVECRISLQTNPAQQGELQINQTLLSQLVEAAKIVQTHSPQARGFSVGELLRWPGVLESQGQDNDSLSRQCLEALQQALQEFTASRGREGEKLKQVLIDRLDRIHGLLEEIKPKLPAILQGWQQRLNTRLKEALDGQVEDDRLKQEFALFAQKIDIDEELERLHTHLTEVRRALNKGGLVGKRLDFLMQELNREANTLGSKSVSTETTQTAVELKVLIEQMREQVQNIE
ncbi:MAG: YicC/YloC family endoribonuclease [Aquaspirillum sp.]